MNSKEKRRWRRERERQSAQVKEEIQKQLLQRPLPVSRELSPHTASVPISGKGWGRQLFLLGKKVLGVLGFFALCIGVTNDSFALNPRMSAQTTDIFDPRDPSTAWIIITNDNNYWLNDVQYACVQLAGESNGWSLRENWVTPHQNRIENLAPGGTETLSCAAIGQEMFPGSATINFIIVVSFFPASMPYRTERIFRFEGTCGPDGKCHIVQRPAKPLSETGLRQNPDFKNRWNHTSRESTE
jgi:hypothetical protein